MTARGWRFDAGQRSTAVASIVSQPSWSCAHSATLPVGAGRAADMEGVQVEGGPHGAEAEARHVGARPLAPQQVHQQRGDQRAVHDQARVAFDLGDVLAVVVDAVAVEGERGVAEQQHVVGHDLALPLRLAFRLLGRRVGLAGLAQRAVDDVVELHQRGIGLPLQRTSWRTLTNTSSPVRPDLDVTSSMVEVRSTASPTRIGERNSNWLPAHMRRGSGTGGRKPPRLAWPSAPISDCRWRGRKYSQCHSGGSGRPAAASMGSWSSVALSASTGVGPMASATVSVRPIQSAQSLLPSVIACLHVVVPMPWSLPHPAHAPKCKLRKD
jgi:hypothetical protein